MARGWVRSPAIVALLVFAGVAGGLALASFHVPAAAVVAAGFAGLAGIAKRGSP
jgi:hypothetical protein